MLHAQLCGVARSIGCFQNQLPATTICVTKILTDRLWHLTALLVAKPAIVSGATLSVARLPSVRGLDVVS